MLRIILLSEYLRTVKTKAYWLVTLLTPLFFFVAGATVAYFGADDSRTDGAASYRLAVLGGDERTLAALGEAAGQDFRFLSSADNLEGGKQAVLDGGVDALLVLPDTAAVDGEAPAARLHVRKAPSLLQRSRLQNAIANALRDVRLAAFDLPPAVYAAMEERVELAVVHLTNEGERRAGGRRAAVLGCVIALVLMVVTVMYGGNVMQMVMEEKSSRMAEIIVSSVRPFELMLGKILAAALLGATQLLLWAVVGSLFLGIALALVADPDAVAELAEAAKAFQTSGDAKAGAATVTSKLQLPRLIAAAALALVLLPVAFLLHASIFAALGAMFEQTTTAQNAILVGLLPAISGIALAGAAVMQEGGRALVFGSFFPFSSPAMLPARVLAGDMPAWQVVLSLALLAASTFATVWLAGRVFRGSLLMLGKVPTFRDLRIILFES